MGSTININQGSTIKLSRNNCTSNCVIAPSCGGPPSTIPAGCPPNISSDTTVTLDIGSVGYNLTAIPGGYSVATFRIISPVTGSDPYYSGSIDVAMKLERDPNNPNGAIIVKNSLKLTCLKLYVVSTFGNIRLSAPINTTAIDYKAKYDINYYVNYGANVPYNTQGTMVGSNETTYCLSY